ncbi:MAG: AAA family ATPase [Alphaproteobacteria bacterium]|nr:MAG: AAA family ATPase [Alphaproteobacteria bacterium]
MPTWDARNFLVRATLLREKVTSFTDYPFSIPAIGGLDTIEFDRPVTFFVGENGAGKSTLLEAIAIGMGLNPEGGSRNFRFATRESHSGLSKVLRLSRSVRRVRDSYFLRAESYFNLATEIEALDREPGGPPIIDAYGGKSLHEQSHGESFFSLFMHRLRGNGLYFFDEPEAALSPTRQLSFLSRLHDLVKEGSQFLIATHSPILLAYPDAAIHVLDDGPPRRIEYRDTEHYGVTRTFLNDTERMLDILLDREPDRQAP